MNDSITAGSRTKRICASLGVAIFWLLTWQLIYVVVGKDILVVSPMRAGRRLLELSARLPFWRSVGSTLWSVITGFAAGLAAGAALAALTAQFRAVYLLVRPLLVVMKATPVASFIILALIWISEGRLPAFIAFLMVMPMMWSNLYEGIAGIGSELPEMAAVFGFSRWKRVRFIYIPALLPYFVAACSVGLGFAWKSVVAAEVIAHPPHAVGSRIYEAKVYLETADLFAWTIAVVLLSVLLERAAMLLLRRLVRTLTGNGKGARHG